MREEPHLQAREAQRRGLPSTVRAEHKPYRARRRSPFFVTQEKIDTFQSTR